MIAFAALIWMGAVIGMPAGYYVLTGIGAAICVFKFILDIAKYMKD